MPRRRPIRLNKRSENHLLLVGRNADAGVGYVETHADRLVVSRLQFHGDLDSSLFSELDRIPDQVRQHLAESGWISNYSFGHVGIHPVVDLKALFMCAS